MFFDSIQFDSIRHNMLVGHNYSFFFFDLINCYTFYEISNGFHTLCLGLMPEISTPFLPISLTKALENTSVFSQSFTLH